MCLTDNCAAPTTWVPDGLECFSVVRFEKELQEELLTEYGRELLAANSEEIQASSEQETYKLF